MHAGRGGMALLDKNRLPVNVAVVVDGAGEPGLLEGGGEVVDVGLGEPWRERHGVGALRLVDTIAQDAGHEVPGVRRRELLRDTGLLQM